MTCSVWCNGMSQILRVSRRHGAVAAVISAIIFNKYCNSSQICSFRSVQLRTQYTPSKLFGCSLHKYRILTPFQQKLVIHVILVSGQIEAFGKNHSLYLVQRASASSKKGKSYGLFYRGLLGYHAESKNC